MKEVLSKVIKAGVEYVTVEVFFKDYTPTKYPLTQIKQWISSML